MIDFKVSSDPDKIIGTLIMCVCWQYNLGTLDLNFNVHHGHRVIFYMNLMKVKAVVAGSYCFIYLLPIYSGGLECVGHSFVYVTYL
jgi:hypothetical protein